MGCAEGNSIERRYKTQKAAHKGGRSTASSSSRLALLLVGYCFAVAPQARSSRLFGRQTGSMVSQHSLTIFFWLCCVRKMFYSRVVVVLTDSLSVAEYLQPLVEIMVGLWWCVRVCVCFSPIPVVRLDGRVISFY